MAKTLTIFLATTPYDYENSQTAMKLAETDACLSLGT